MFVCLTCEGGFICKGCIAKFDPSGSIFGNKAYVKKTIKCPCCRQLNWRYHFNQIIQTTLGYDLGDIVLNEDTPCLTLFVSNQDNL